MNNNNSSWTLPLTLLAFYFVVFTLCAIEPYDRNVWWAENIPVLIVVGAILVRVLFFYQRRVELANLRVK